MSRVPVRVSFEETTATFLGPDAKVAVAVRFSGDDPPETRARDLEDIVGDAWSRWYEENQDPSFEDGWNTQLIDRVVADPKPVTVPMGPNDWALLRAHAARGRQAAPDPSRVAALFLGRG